MATHARASNDLLPYAYFNRVFHYIERKIRRGNEAALS